MSLISKYVSYDDAIFSETAARKGIDNTPDATQLENIKYVASYIDLMEQHFRTKFNEPNKRFIGWSSFFRSKKLNIATGGSSSTSFHIQGAAVDARSLDPRISNKDLFFFIKENLPFTELIWEFGDDKNPAWAHFAILKGREKEKEILKAIKVVNPKTKKLQTKYIPFS